MLLSKFELEWLIAFMMIEISAYTTNIVLSTCQLIYTFFHYFFLRYWFIRTNLNNEIPTIKATCNASFNFIPRIKLKYEIFDRIYYFSEKSIYIYTSYTLPKEKSSKNIVPNRWKTFSSQEGDQIFFSKTRASKTRILVKDSSPKTHPPPSLQKQPPSRRSCISRCNHRSFAR